MDKEALIEAFKKALGNHDFYYGYSDDYSYWTAGKRTEALMSEAKRALAAVDKELAEKMYWDARPKDASY